MKKIVIVSLILLLAGCRSGQPLIADPPPDLDRYMRNPPVMEEDKLVLRRLPEGYDGKVVLAEVHKTLSVFYQWLGVPPPSTRLNLLIFTPSEKEGKWLLRRDKSGVKAGGRYSTGQKRLVMAGDPNDPRFRTVLRHESIHFAMDVINPDSRFHPFWLVEGVAMLFEQGVDAQGRPLPNPERIRYLAYLAKKRSGLNISRFVDRQYIANADGGDYARAWGLVSYLYWKDKGLEKVLRPSEFPELGSGLFARHFLNPGETPKSFETKFRQWILNSM